MMMVFDTETGGFEGTSLLTAYFGIVDDGFNIIDELELFMKPKDGIYHVTGEALEVNHINLIEHSKKAITYKEAGTLLFNFISRHAYSSTKLDNDHQKHSLWTSPKKEWKSPLDDIIKLPDDLEERAKTITQTSLKTRIESIYKIYAEHPNSSINKLEPLGHNIPGDIRMIKEHLLAPGSWDKFVSYRIQDTGTIGNFLKKQGKIPKDISGSLSSYCKHFGIDYSGAHDAKADSIMTLNVYKEMLKL